jgi:hypothetical protein
MLKRFRVTERLTAQLRMELLNVFNRHYFGGVDLDYERARSETSARRAEIARSNGRTSGVVRRAAKMRKYIDREVFAAACPFFVAVPLRPGGAASELATRGYTVLPQPQR